MTTGRINQVAADTGPSTLAAPGQGRRLAAAVAGPLRVAQHFALVANGRLHGTQFRNCSAPRRRAGLPGRGGHAMADPFRPAAGLSCTSTWRPKRPCTRTAARP